MWNWPFSGVTAYHGVSTTAMMALISEWIWQKTRTMPGRRKVTLRCGARRIQRQIEGLAGEVGKGVVEEGVEIREIDRAAHGNGHHVGFESLVLLFHFRASGARAAARCAAHRFQPEDNPGVIAVAADGRLPSSW